MQQGTAFEGIAITGDASMGSFSNRVVYSAIGAFLVSFWGVVSLLVL